MSPLGLSPKRPREIQRISETRTPFGDGFEIEVLIGNEKKKCYLIKDKETGEWKNLGDPRACQILASNLRDIGIPLETKLRALEAEG